MKYFLLTYFSEKFKMFEDDKEDGGSLPNLFISLPLSPAEEIRCVFDEI